MTENEISIMQKMIATYEELNTVNNKIIAEQKKVIKMLRESLEDLKDIVDNFINKENESSLSSQHQFQS